MQTVSSWNEFHYYSQKSLINIAREYLKLFLYSYFYRKVSSGYIAIMTLGLQPENTEIALLVFFLSLFHLLRIGS